MSSHYAEKRKTKAVIIAAVVAIFLILAFVSFVRKQASVAPRVEPVVEEKGRTLSDAPSQFSVDPNLPNTTIYTSYKLGVKFQYQTLASTQYAQTSCPPGFVTCPTITDTTKAEPPIEKDNSITFRNYRLEVFDKRSSETIEEAIQRNIFPTEDFATCPVKVYTNNSDKVVKAVITGMPDASKCSSRYSGFTKGHHFFVYPTYPNVLLFAEGPAGSQAVFSHTGTWIGTIRIAQ